MAKFFLPHYRNVKRDENSLLLDRVADVSSMRVHLCWSLVAVVTAKRPHELVVSGWIQAPHGTSKLKVPAAKPLSG